MNNYTIPLCDIIEEIWNEGHKDETHSIFNSNKISNLIKNIDEKLEYALPTIFQFNYPYYGDEEDKKELEKHILRAYYTRNINCDSVARWLLFLQDKLEDIMPRYVAIYNAQTELIASEILNPYHITETKDKKSNSTKSSEQSYEGTSSNETSNTSTTGQNGTESSEASSTNKVSDTPQALAETGKDYLTTMSKEDGTTSNQYANESNSKANGTSSASGSSSTSELTSENKNEDYTKIIKGNISKDNNAKLIAEYENVIINIEQMITKELSDLFYLIY